MVIVTALLVVAELVLANRPDDAREPRLVLFGPSTAVLLLMLAVLARTARNEYARAVRPVLRPVSKWSATSDWLAVEASSYRIVELTNVGNSLAVIAHVTWTVSSREGHESARFDDVKALQSFLDNTGFAEGRDYAIANYARGTALAAREARTYFECSQDVVQALSTFDAVIQYASLSGDTYERAIPLLPQPGSSVSITRSSPRAVA